MKKIRAFLSLLLAVLMTVGVFGSAYAATETYTLLGVDYSVGCIQYESAGGAYFFSDGTTTYIWKDEKSPSYEDWCPLNYGIYNDAEFTDLTDEADFAANDTFYYSIAMVTYNDSVNISPEADKCKLKVPGFEDFGDMWECPSIETISGYDVLIFCPQHLKLQGRGGSVHHSGYLLGHMDWENLTFRPDNTSFHVLDFGFDSYAAECAANPHDRNKATLVAWMGLPDASYPTDEEDWSGCLTLPRELRVRDRRLIQQPLDELRALRGEKLDLETTNLLPRVSELELISRGGDLNLRLFADADGNGGLTICYDDDAKEITVDRSGLKKRFNTEQGEQRTRPLPKGLFHLRVFIDRSSIEIFVNDGDAVFSSRIFPTNGEERLFISGDASVHLWKLNRAVTDDFVV